MGTEGKLLVLAREDGVLEGVGLESRQKVETFELVNCTRAFFPLFVPSFLRSFFLPSFLFPFSVYFCLFLPKLFTELCHTKYKKITQITP